MPLIKKIPQGKLNYDASKALLPANDYNDALNINIDSDGVRSVKGNRLLDAVYSATGYWCAGSYYDKTRRRVYAFMANTNQQHRIVAVDVAASTITTLFENETDSGGTDIFGWAMPAMFDASKVIKNICVVHRDFGGDLVYFIDPNKIPLKFNYDTLLAGDYGAAPTIEMFKVICPPPVTQPSVIYANDAARSINNLKKKLFQFRYRFVYGDDEKSVWSAGSKTPLPPKNDDQEYYLDGTKANVIQLTLLTGIKTVKKIELIARQNVASNWSDWFLIDTINKEELSVADDTVYQYNFYNDGAYDYVDLEEVNLLFDYVPDEANCLVLANGNVLVYGGIKEGLNKEIEMDVSATSGAEAPTITTLTYDISFFAPGGGAGVIQTITFIGVAEENDEIRVQFNWYTDGLLAGTFDYTYTVLSGDTLEDIVDAIVAQITAADVVLIAENPVSPADSFTIYHDASSTEGNSVDTLNITITQVLAAGETDSIPCLKWKGRYAFGIAYYRNDGKTRGVYIPTDNSWTIDTEAYSEDAGDAEIPFVELAITHAPPSWADYFHIVRTKELTSRRSLFVIDQACGQDTDYHYLQIDNLLTHITDFPATSAILNYEFTEGDRLRVIKKVTATAAIFASDDIEILGVVTDPPTLTGDFIKIKRTTTTDTFGFGTGTNRHLVEIYSPAQTVENDLNVYYEVGERYPIYIDGNGNRSHSGKSQNQIIGTGAQDALIKITEGDYYFRQRRLTTGASGIFTDADPYACMDANFSDAYLSGVHNEGRPLVIDDNIKEQYYPGLIRHSLQYIQGTNVNELSRFYADNFEEADISYGDVLNMRTRENFIRVFQRFKVGMVPVLRQIYFDTSGSQTVATSERILNKINYYAGDYGIDKYGLSLVSTDNGDYFIDDINRCLVRASLDGITNISETFEASVWWQANVQNGYSGIGYYDYENRLIVLAVIKTDNTKDYVIGFSEKRKGFMSRYSYTAAESFLFVDGYPWAFYQGKPYVHDSANRCTFFGTTTAPFITLVFNDGVDFKKSFTNIATVSNRKWGATAIATSTGQASNLKIEDFKLREDGYHAAFLRDTASPKGLNGGDTLKGNWIEVKLEGGAASSLDATPRDEIDATDEYNITMAAVYFNESNLNKR
jgi:hypothetical protein